MRSPEPEPEPEQKHKPSCTVWPNCCCWSLRSNRDSSQCFSAVVENCDVKSVNYGRFFFVRLTERARIFGCVGVLEAFWSESGVYSVVNSCVLFEICLVVLCCKICTTSCISETTSSLCWFVSMCFCFCLLFRNDSGLCLTSLKLECCTFSAFYISSANLNICSK